MTSTMAPRWRRPGWTAVPVAVGEEKAVGRALVRASAAVTSDTPEQTLQGVQPLHAESADDEQQVTRRERLNRLADLGIDGEVGALEDLRRPTAFLLGRIGARPRLRRAPMAMAGQVERLMAQRRELRRPLGGK